MSAVRSIPTPMGPLQIWAEGGALMRLHFIGSSALTAHSPAYAGGLHRGRWLLDVEGAATRRKVGLFSP